MMQQNRHPVNVNTFVGGLSVTEVYTAKIKFEEPTIQPERNNRVFQGVGKRRTISRT